MVRVDVDDVEEHWSGVRRVKPGRERWIPTDHRPENSDVYPETARQAAKLAGAETA